MSKVYCGDCKYLDSSPRGDWVCKAKENTIEYDSWISRKIYYRHFPSKINANNDCKWFEKETPRVPPPARP